MLKNQLNDWAPGQGVNHEATLRLQKHFHAHPVEAVGEAWFMGETRAIYHELLTANYSEISHDKWSEYLWDIGNGICCFDGADQFREWFDYLMVRMDLVGAPQSFGYQNLIEHLLEGIYVAYPQQLPDEIRIDLLLTVGRVLLQPSFWQNELYLESVAMYGYLPRFFSIILLFNLKYRKSDEVFSWVESLCSFKCIHWRSCILLWFVGLIDLFEGRFKILADFSDLTNFNIARRLKNESLTLEEYFNRSPITYSRERFGVQQAMQGKPLPLLELNLCFKTSTLVSNWFSDDTLREMKQSICHVLSQELLSSWLDDCKNAPGRYHPTLLGDLENYPSVFLDYYHPY